MRGLLRSSSVKARKPRPQPTNQLKSPAWDRMALVESCQTTPPTSTRAMAGRPPIRTAATAFGL